MEVHLGNLLSLYDYGPYLLQSDIPTPLEHHIANRPWTLQMSTEHFQTHDGNLNIRPRFDLDIPAALSVLNLPSSDCTWEVLILGLNPSELQMWSASPCPLFVQNSQPTTSVLR